MERLVKISLVVACFFSSAAFGQYEGGSGTAEDPYQIKTAAQMNTIGAMLLHYDKHFRLIADIDLSAYTGTSFFIIGMYPDYPFTGVFDGNGHTISNFTYSSTGTSYIGVFGYADSNAEIKNLGLINAKVDAGTGSKVGSLVGLIREGSITNCYVEGGSVSGRALVGGLVGENRYGRTTNCSSNASVSGTEQAIGGLVGSGGNITNCYSSGSVSAAAGSLGLRSVGGLVGSGGNIANCYSTGSVSVSGNDVWGIGGLVGRYGNIANCYSSANVSASGSNVHGTGGLVGVSGNIANCYSTGSISGVDNVGGLAGENDGAVVNCYSTGSVTGVTEVGGLVGWNDGMVSASFWDIQTSGEPNSAGGTGLTTAEMQDVNTFLVGGWDFVGEYTNGPSDDWAEPETQGYMILWWQLPEDQLPALPTFSGGTGEANDPYLISTTTDLNRIGHNPRLMEKHFKLINDIDLAGVEFFIIASRGLGYSGVFDGNGHTISNFTYSSPGTDYIGFFSYVKGQNTEIKDLGLVDPNIIAGTGDYVGSLVGWLADGTISSCYVGGGSVSGNLGVGGLTGYNDSTITNCSSNASVSGTDYGVGGLVGDSMYGTITKCHSNGIVLSTGSFVGGLVGRGGVVTDCSSTCEVSGRYGTIGGLVGAGGGPVTNCYALGDVSGDLRVGGLLGGGGPVTKCYSAGSVTGDRLVGGLVGENWGSSTITDCYSTGDVSGNNVVGGLVGNTKGSGNISNCYSTGSVTGTTEVGGLIGRNESGTISGSFWDVQTSGLSNMCGSQDPNFGSGCDDGYGKTTAEMQDPNTFLLAGWDFVGEDVNGTNDIWRMCVDGINYPHLFHQYNVNGDFACPDGVEIDDVLSLGNNWLNSEELDPGFSYPCDPTFDGLSNLSDFVVLAEHWLDSL